MRRMIPSLLWFSVLAGGPACFAKGRESARVSTSCMPLPVIQTQEAGDKTIYLNRAYGFSFELPQSWKGFSVLQCEWDGTRDSGASEQQGPLLRIRHPLYTEENPREDIPIMVFTQKQWREVQDMTLIVSAAPIPPGMIGQNRKYVFALPPRFSFDELEGVEEVLKIVQTKPLCAIRIVRTSRTTKKPQ